VAHPELDGEVPGFHDPPGHLVAVFEHLPQLGLQETAGRQASHRSQGRLEFQFIPEEGAALAIIAEEMAMEPGSERPMHLAIGEHSTRLILRMLGDPPEPDRAQADGQHHA
jgi:hypothetical protein